MDDASINSRLSRITTVWTVLGDAHRGSQDEAREARVAFMRRYQGAVYRYLLGAVRNPDAADELFQEFALKFIEGSFGRADPQRGRFRDYLRTALMHLVTDYQRRQQKRPCPLDTSIVQPEAPAAAEATDSEAFFQQSWREELLARAWAVLQQAQQGGGPPYYSALRFRAENPKASSAETAARLTETLHLVPPLSETAVRKTLQRAREKFADALIDDVAHSLGAVTREEVERELIELELLPYCRSALARRWPHQPGS